MDASDLSAKNILFLGYSKKETCLHSILEDKGCLVDHTDEKNIVTSNIDLIISFGYRYIIPKEVIINSYPIVNLHISLLPFNRGSHPNFWSHFDGTPSGVTIHLIDQGIDTGPYLFQKKIDFDTKKITFKESYQILINELENLFIDNIDEILSLNFTTEKCLEKGTYHSSRDLPKEVNWNNIIDDELKVLKEI